MCPFFTTLALLAVLSALVYIFLIWNFGYWQRRGIKCAKSYPFVGSFPSLFTQKRNVAYDIDDLYRKYKKSDNFIGVLNCRLPQVLILSPEYVRKVFVNDFRSFHDNEFSKFTDKQVDAIFANNPFVLTGDEWKERRAEVTPGLTANRVNAVYPVTLEVCKNFVTFISRQQKMAGSNGIDVKRLCLCYTTEVVSDCVLGISAQSFTETPTPIVGMIAHVFDHSFWFILYSALVNLWPPISKIYMARIFDKKTEDFFFDLMKNAIELRQQTKDIQRVDFLNYMLQLQEKKGLNTMELTSHTMTFLTDGFETTASVITHTLYLLARSPDAQERLRQEVGEAPLSFEALSELPYLDACLHESLRIFPPLLTARKVCTEPYKLVNKDGVSVNLQPGDVAIVPAYSLHHDPEFYDQPEEFKPERFLSASGDGLRNYQNMGVYLGFGDGPRICPGMRFALTQTKAALVEVVRNFNVKLNPKSRKDNRLHDTFFMAALHGGIWLDFEERSN